MKRLIFLTFVLLAFASFTATAQYVDVSFGRITSAGEKLTDQQARALFSDVEGLDRSDSYTRFRNNYKAGTGLMIGGSACILCSPFLIAYGVVFALIPDTRNFGMAGLVLGSVMFYGGTACFITGIPLLCVNNSRLKSLAEAYNDSSSRSVELSFGPTASGVGLALNF